MALKDLKVVTKVTEAEFPGLPDFKIRIGAISREMSRKLREQSEINKVDPKTRQIIKEIDEDKFVKLFTREAIKGWSGLKYKYLQELMLVDLSSVEDLEEELPYSEEDALEMVKESATFDSWLNEVVFSLDTFRS